MTANSLHLANLVMLASSAGLLMLLAGTQKKMLRWKEARRRCPACGRTDRHDCACRR